ncbi:MAG TPA: tyrosinase family protein [Burkholderiaceae bacterium]
MLSIRNVGAVQHHIQLIALALAAACSLSCAAAAQAADSAKPEVELLVRSSADFKGHYDYVSWAPAPALIRVRPAATGSQAANALVTVVLTNESAAAPGRGYVNFSSDALAYRKAVDGGAPDLDRMTMWLKADGTPQPLVVAGAFPHYSSSDKDAAIVIHLGTADGPVLGKTRLMVRVRRNEETLSAEEKQRFLWALAALRFRKHGNEPGSIYDFMVNMHDVGARGFYYPAATAYPDQEHKAAGFLPWHRAFLLELERDLQEIDPSVALPYWPMYLTPGGQPASVFHADFTGKNAVVGGSDFYVPDLIGFDPGNPLYGWSTSANGPLMRWSVDRTQVGNFSKPGDLIEESRANPRKGRYAFIAGSVESNPHNIGHGWSGIWMSNCSISPSDPMFWPFHTYFDWLWAAWQQHYGRLNADGKDVADYWPNDHYQENGETKQIPLGHHLLDTMWPWNEESQPKPVEVFNSRRPPQLVGGKFAPSGAAGLWPQQPAAPTPGNFIDYAGYTDNGDDTGVAYDNIPWSPTQAMPPFPGNSAPDAQAFATLLDVGGDVQARSAAAHRVDLAQAADTDKLAAVEAIALAQQNAPALRLAALELLTQVDTAAAVETAYQMKSGGNTALKQAIENVRHMQMFANRPLNLAGASNVGANEDEAPAPEAPTLDKKIYANARNAVPDNDPGTVAGLTAELDKFLANPHAAVRILPQDAVAFIAATNVLAVRHNAHSHAMMGSAASDFSREKTIATLRRLVAARPTRVAPEIDWWKTKALAAIALGWDRSAASSRLVLHLASDHAAPVETRASALNGLRRNDPAAFERIAFVLAADRNTDAALRANAIAAVGAYTTDHGVTLTPADRARLGAALGRLDRQDLPPQARAALATTKKLLALANN